MCETGGQSAKSDSSLEQASVTIEDAVPAVHLSGFIFGDGNKQMTKKTRPPEKPAPSGNGSSARPAVGPDERLKVLSICILLAAITLAVFGQTLRFGFVNYDDDANVYENSAVAGGLTPKNITSAFTHASTGTWDPLTTLSHLLDCQLYGLHAGGHHLTNVFLHTASVLLLFLVLRKMTGALWKSAFVAAVFAIHPLHVESVAWVSERKDVLSGFFFMLTLWAYARYANGPARLSRYLMVVLFFVLGLMSKAMLVSLPLFLLLMDYWPLGRMSKLGVGDKGVSWARLLIEKLPLFALSVGFAVVAYFAQGRAVQSLELIPLDLRLENALVSLAAYLGRMFLPVGLVAYYPFPINGLPGWEITMTALMLVFITVAAWHWRGTRPYVHSGWLWYLVMLLPVMGLIQLAGQARADRYTYLPHIGLYVALTWLAWDFCRGARLRREALATAGVAVIAALGVGAFIQTSYWRDSKSLWKHTLDCNPHNAVAFDNLGALAFREGHVGEALADFQKAVQWGPDYAQAFGNLGNALLKTGRVDDAINAFQRAVELEPGDAAFEGDLGNAWLQKGRVDEAVANFQKSLTIEPDNYDVHNNLGVVLFHEGRLDEAIPHILKALELRPDSVPARNNLAGIAWALAASPDDSVRNGAKAVELAKEADRLSGGTDPVISCVLAGAFAEAGRFPEAVATAQRSLQLASAQSNTRLAAAVEQQLAFYQAGRPFRDASLHVAPAQGTR
jgi:tetratricopeptide (TPR) repeat protein